MTGHYTCSIIAQYHASNMALYIQIACCESRKHAQLAIHIYKILLGVKRSVGSNPLLGAIFPICISAQPMMTILHRITQLFQCIWC